jgi:2-amino-4-hydroxy-6-hydroxymethyldihydropteridine diphosphokinase
MMQDAYIALGTNLGARITHMRAAIIFLESISETAIQISFLYETPPWGVLDQPPFLNAVAHITTNLSPHALLAELKKAEEDLGRVYTRRWGPRQIDLDILLYGDGGTQTVDTENLKIPHVSMQDREFVLRPLCEYACRSSPYKMWRLCVRDSL